MDKPINFDNYLVEDQKSNLPSQRHFKLAKVLVKTISIPIFWQTHSLAMPIFWHPTKQALVSVTVRDDIVDGWSVRCCERKKERSLLVVWSTKALMPM